MSPEEFSMPRDNMVRSQLEYLVACVLIGDQLTGVHAPRR